MALVQDPSFWKRFSTAVHLDEKQKQSVASAAKSPDGRPTLKHSESWLDRQKKKKSRRTLICWIFWIVFVAIITGVVVAVLLLKQYGIVSGKKMEISAPDANAGSYAIGGNGP